MGPGSLVGLVKRVDICISILVIARRNEHVERVTVDNFDTSIEAKERTDDRRFETG